MRYLFFTFLLTPIVLCAQNCELIRNGGFEDYTECPTSIGQIANAFPWDKVGPNSGSTDYLNECVPQFNSADVPVNLGGFQYAKSGKAYIGIINYSFTNEDYAEYIHQKLLSSMVTGETYRVSFYWNLGDNSGFASDVLGVLFTTDSVYSDDYNVLPHAPQVTNPPGNMLNDTVNWVLFSQDYTATDSFSYVTIGNFLPNTAHTITEFEVYGPTSHLYIDDVSVICITCNASSQNISASFCTDDAPVNLFDFLEEDLSGGEWTPELTSGTDLFDPSTDVSGVYNFMDTCGSVTAIVDITVNNCNLFTPNAFTPNGDNVNDVFHPNTEEVAADGYVLEIYNQWGQKITETNDVSQGWDGTHKGKKAKQGLYTYYLSYKGKGNQLQQEVGKVTLTR